MEQLCFGVRQHVSHLFFFNAAITLNINRCNIDRLKLLKKPLPLSDPFPEVWQKVSKIIGKSKICNIYERCLSSVYFVDRLHISNHTRAECSVLYNPNREGLENVNTMICEQVITLIKIQYISSSYHRHFHG